MALEGYLAERLAQIIIEREEVLVRLEEIRSKMKRADAKRAGQENTPNYKKWSSILRGLEHDHDKHKAMVTTLEAESKEKTARLEKIRSEREAHQSKLEENYNRIMSLPPEEMAALTPEDMELLQEYELQLEAAEKAANAPPEDEVEPAAPEEKPIKYVQVTEFQSPRKEPDVPATAQVTEFKPSKEEPSKTPEAPPSAPAEIAALEQAPPQPETAVPTPESPPAESVPSPASPSAPPAELDAKSRRKHAFQSALEKSRVGAITELTFEEVGVMLTAYQKLASQPSDNPSASALEENVSYAMWEVHAHCARICANWADLMRRDASAKR